MFMQMLPWLLVVGLAGIVIGLMMGFYLASALVKGHYAHAARLNKNAGYAYSHEPMTHPHF